MPRYTDLRIKHGIRLNERLNEPINVKGRIRKNKNRNKIVRFLLEYQREKCYLCSGHLDASKKYPHPESITIDHIVPKSQLGGSLIQNLRLTHHFCNSLKGGQRNRLDKSYYQYQLKKAVSQLETPTSVVA